MPLLLRRRLLAMVALSLAVLGAPVVDQPPASAATCLTAVACENQLPGSPPSEWDIAGTSDPSIVGFSTEISVNPGGTIRFKINTDASSYRIDIYRMGYYQGNGARKVASIMPFVALPQQQPACLSDSTTGLVDCGNWAVSARWTLPTSAVSGIYFAHLVRPDTGADNHVMFVVRSDLSHSAIVFQTSDTTWQAYNDFGGNSLYKGSPAGRAYKVSYNRPFNTRDGTPGGQDWVFANEYPMVRWLEHNGYDVSYQSGVDTDRFGNLLRNHKVFVSVGHDEYWSGQQRANVEAARDAGVSLGFFSGNEVYWKTRWEPSIDASQENYRTLVTYKETWAQAKIDPSPAWTGTWRDPRFSPPSDGGRPENQLSGTWFKVQTFTSAITVPSSDARMRIWRNTSVASTPPGSTATLAANTLGYEFDETPDNGFQPPGLVPLSTTTVSVQEYLYDYGINVTPATATHHLTLYRAPSGARVFSAGTIQWSWGLDSHHDGPNAPPDDVRMRQATMNVLADLGAYSSTPESDLVRPFATTDTTPPVATIRTPAPGAVVRGDQTTTIAGRASDSGGRVGAVEVSTDGGTTWHPAKGRTSWTYSWIPTGDGPTTVLARAADDSGNLQTTPASVAVTKVCPCTIFGNTAPGVAPLDPNAVSLGVKFTADTAGTVTGIRFYKTPGNGGTHTGSLWTSSGTRLAHATFASETATGWQQVIFDAPVAVSAGDTSIASYDAPQGNYAVTGDWFTRQGTDAPPLHALQNGVSGGNGVYAYGSDPFPTSTFNNANYWVDVLFTPSG